MQGGVSSCTIIEALDEIKGSTSSLCSGLKRLAINAFAFETMEETFHGCIIVTVSSTAHAHHHAFLPQERLITLTRVGTSTIRVMEQPGLWTATNDGHVQRLHD